MHNLCLTPLVPDVDIIWSVSVLSLAPNFDGNPTLSSSCLAARGANMAAAPVIDFGDRNGCNRFCAGLVFRLRNGSLRQASGTLVQLSCPDPAGGPADIRHVILVPASVLREKMSIQSFDIPGTRWTTTKVDSFAICAADKDNNIRLVWNVSSKGVSKQDAAYVLEREHYAICSNYKPNAPDRKEADWAAIVVDPTWCAEVRFKEDGYKTAFSARLGGQGGVFNFPLVDPAVPSPAWNGNFCIVGFPKVSLRGVYGKRTGLRREYWNLVSCNEDSKLLKRQLTTFTAPPVQSWGEADAAVRRQNVPGGLPKEERMFSPVVARNDTWPWKVAQQLGRLVTFKPLKGGGSKPAFAERPEAELNTKLVAAVGRGDIVGAPDTGWAGGAWLSGSPWGIDPADLTAANHRVLGMHIGTTSFRPHLLYFGCSLESPWTGKVATEVYNIRHGPTTDPLEAS
jgi:hypothetical protein